MGDTINIGEYEFKWEFGNQGGNYSISLFITKPRLMKFANEFTAKQMEELAQHKLGVTDFVGLIRAALKKSSPRITVGYSFVEDASDFQVSHLGMILTKKKIKK